MREITAKQGHGRRRERWIFGDPEKKIGHICLDSRKMEGRDLLFLSSENGVDAHRFICQAISAGGRKRVQMVKKR